MKQEFRKTSELKLWEDNPRNIKPKDFERLKKQIQELGQYKPLLITEDGTVIGGNMRLRAYMDLGIEDVWVSVVNPKDDNQMLAYALSDNDRAGYYDDDLLANLSSAYPDFEWGNYAVDLQPPTTLDDLFKAEVEEDEAPEVDETAEPVSKLGEVYQLGRHRLMCGDSTKIEDVERLMNGQKADIGFTSPPYNAGKTPTEVKMGKDSKYANDSDSREDSEYFNLLHKSTELSNKFTEYNFINLQLLSGNKLPLLDFIYYYKDRLADIIIWNKLSSQPAMAENVLNSQFEFVFVLSDNGNRHIGTKSFRGTLSNVVDISKQNRNEVKEHNATFPVEFAGHFVRNFSSNSVLDLFGGSGSTLIACEQLNRTCYMMELDPKYCDVIRKRYAKFIGKEETWEEVSPRVMQADQQSTQTS